MTTRGGWRGHGEAFLPNELGLKGFGFHVIEEND